MGLRLSIGLVSNPRTWPILNGAIKPEGIDLIPTVVREPHFGLDTVPGSGVKATDVYKYERTSSAPSARHVYDRQVKYGDFDVSEVPMTLVIMSVANAADDRWVGLPIFLSRRFFHMEILSGEKTWVSKNRRISKASKLAL